MKKIIFERDKCIGCGNCGFVCPQYWEMGEDGRSNLKGGKKSDETNNIELEVEEVGCNKEAEDSCPTLCIHIKEI